MVTEEDSDDKKLRLTLEPGTFAVTWDNDTGWRIYVPDDSAPLSREASALMAAMIRLQSDPDFQQECVDWLTEKKRRAS